MGEPVLAVAGLTLRAGSRTVVEDVSFTVAAGEIVALVGESGAGKSLVGRAVLGLLPDGITAAGSVTLGESEVVGAPEPSLRRLRGAKAGLVFQDPHAALNPAQTVGRQVIEALRAHRRIGRRDARAEAIALLAAVGIPEPKARVDWYPHRLSGGQRQRVMTAVALAGRPALLIADEPTTALDVGVQAQMLALLVDLTRRTGLGILLITHDLGVVAEVADRVAVLRAGTLVEQASTAQLFTAPAHPYTRQLLAAVPRVRLPPTSDRIRRPMLEVIDLRVDYPARGPRPTHPALHNVSLSVGAGEVLGIVGESGSGKTTLGRVALGLEAYRGTLRRHTDRVALVHQNPLASLDPRWPVWRSITEPLRIAGLRDRDRLWAKALEMLDAVRLAEPLAQRRPAELSGGQRQRVALARALVRDPELLVADEPTSALDVSVQADLLALFRQLQRERGFAALFISHDLAVVSEIADRVAVLRHGTLVEIGPTGQVFGRPGHPYTRQLLAAMPNAHHLLVRDLETR
jgi:peptide/nickel transport system ATP-binding protein